MHNSAMRFAYRDASRSPMWRVKEDVHMEIRVVECIGTDELLLDEIGNRKSAVNVKR